MHARMHARARTQKHQPLISSFNHLSIIHNIASFISAINEKREWERVREFMTRFGEMIEGGERETERGRGETKWRTEEQRSAGIEYFCN